MATDKDNFTDIYWKHQVRLKRRLRTIRDDGARQVYCDQLIAHGIPVDVFIDRWLEDPLTVMQTRLDEGVNQPNLPPPSVDLNDYPTASDLILTVPPFNIQWAAEQGDPDWKSDPATKKDAVKTRWTPNVNDNTEIGAEVHIGDKVYEKLLMVAEGGSYDTAVADPASGGTPFWFRTK